MRVYSTSDGMYPEPGYMVLWQYLDDTYIGGYSASTGWFAQGDEDTGDQPTGAVLWAYLPELSEIYGMQIPVQPELFKGG